MDSSAVIKLATQEVKDDHRLALADLIKDIRDLLAATWEVILQHAFREGNACADWLAKTEARRVESIPTWDCPPPETQFYL